MERYAQPSGQLDDASITDGDRYFTGFLSRYQPTLLTEGQASYAGNVRMNRGTAKVRNGLKALSQDITLINTPLIVGSFSLAASVAVTSINRSGSVATVITATAHGFINAQTINMRGATQTAYNGDFSITFISSTSFSYTVIGTPTTPATGTILANGGPRVFNNYSSQVVGSGDYADSSTNIEGIVIAGTNSAFLYRYGFSTQTITYPTNETCDVGSPCDVVQFINQIYIFRGYQISSAQAVTSVTSSAGTATVTTTAAHGLATNAWVTMAGASPYNYNGIFQITVTGTTTFTYTVTGSPTSPATGTITARPCKPPLVWNMSLTSPAFTVVPTGISPSGLPYIAMPAVSWGQFFISRMVLPYSKDQLVLSNLLDASTYDPTQNQFRLLPGTADWLVAVHPFQLQQLLVLYRKSVHLITLDSTTLSIASAAEVTRNFGCVARKTVVNCGPSILWLSDNGIVQLQISDYLSLTSNSLPLSDPVQDIIETINWPYASAAVATFWHNRYYIAIPTGTSTVNSTVLVYNFLNQAWESVDTFPSGFDVHDFRILSYNGSERVHAVSTFGYVSLMEEGTVDEFGAPGAIKTYPIAGSLKTRNYLYSTYDLKQVKRFQLEANVTTGDVFTGTYVLSNPDLSVASLSYTATKTTDVSLRALVKRRGVSARLELASTAGQPEFKAVTAEAAITSRKSINFT